MKAESMKERPDYELFKKNDVVSFYHLQLPRWLIEDGRYMSLSLEAKFTYTLLFNRFQLSKHNGWLNENGEVFVIYTRKELSERLNVSEKRISAAMNELKEFRLIWERRRGRGFANQIYLANVKVSSEDAANSKSGPLDVTDTGMVLEEVEDKCGSAETYYDNYDLRPDIAYRQEGRTCLSGSAFAAGKCTEQAVLNDKPPEKEASLFFSNNANSRENGCFLSPASETVAFETPERDFKNRRNGGSKASKSSIQEQPNCPPNYIDFRFREQIYNQSQSMSSQRIARTGGCSSYDGYVGLTDMDIIETLIEKAELDTFSENDAVVIRDAIERLYFMQSIRIGNAIYPNERIRSNLWRLDALVVEDAINKIAKNSAQIRNSSSYVVTVLFNTIMESGSDLLVDPYLNSLRLRHETIPKSMGGG